MGKGHREFRIGTVGGAPLHVDSVLVMALGFLAFIGLFADSHFVRFVIFFLLFAFVVSVAIHELGHYAMALWLGVPVYSIHLTGLGGHCRIEPPEDPRRTVLVFAGGVMAQAAVLVVLGLGLLVSGLPEEPPGQAMAWIVAGVNALGIVANLVPSQGEDGGWSDGAVIWPLLLGGGRPRRD